MEEYLTIEELGKRLKLSPKTIQNKMSKGIFRKGVHFYSPRGLRPRFKWSAVERWLEEKEEEAPESPAAIPMARGYSLRNGTNGTIGD
jgi:hypothetical protein